VETYSIIDLEGYARSVREAAAKSFTETYSENLDEFISVEQVIGLIEENSMGKDEEDNYLITEESFGELFEKIRNRLYSMGLSRLAAKGLVECAWDDETNEMIFWLSDAGATHISNRPSSKNE
jgi:hypothetical protein